MGLLVVDHLDAMLDGPQAAIGIGQCLGDVGLHPPRRDQRGKRVEHRGGRAATGSRPPCINCWTWV